MEFNAYQIAVFAVLILLGVIMISSVVSNSNNDNSTNYSLLNSYTFNFTENPVNGSAIQIDSNVYEFLNNTSDVDNGYIPVQISPDVGDTTNNLRYAIHNTTAVLVS